MYEFKELHMIKDGYLQGFKAHFVHMGAESALVILATFTFVL